MKKIYKFICVIIAIAFILIGNLYVCKEKSLVYNANELPSSFLEKTDEKVVDDFPEKGFLTYGPYSALEKGKYQITLEYVSETDSNVLDIYSVSQKKQYYSENLAKENQVQSIVLELDEDISDLEIRTVYAGTGYFEVKKIVITKEFEWSEYIKKSILAICLLSIIVGMMDKRTRNWLFRLETGAFTVLLLVIVFFCETKVNKDIIQKKYTNYTIWKEVGSAGYFCLDLYETILELVPKSKENYIKEIQAFLSSREVQAYQYPETKQIEKVILIQLEGVDSVALDIKKGEEYVMKNLHALKEEGIWFPNVYDQTGSGRTSDGEFLALTSLLPIEGESMYTHYELSKIDSLPRILAGYGMNSVALHGNEASYWNRKNSHISLGYKKGVYYEDVSHEIEIDYNGWGFSDGTMLAETGKVIEESEGAVFTHTILLTGHHPYDAVNLMDIELPYSNPSSMIENYVNCLYYTDCALGKLIDDLSQNDLLEKSLIVIFADHDSGITKSVYDYMGLTYNATDVNYDKVPLIIYDGKNQYVEENIMGQADIMPLILSYLKLDLPETIMGLNYIDDSKVVYLQNGMIFENKQLVPNECELNIITKGCVMWGGEIAHE